MKAIATPIGQPTKRVPETEADLAQKAIDEQEYEAQRLPNLITQIKELAHQKIIAKYPLWKQSNMHMRANHLNHKLIQGQTLTEAEQQEIVDLDAARVWVESVRAYSDTLEAQAAQDLDIDINAGWPE